MPLRDDSHITTLESAAQEKEPERIAEAQTLKATGALSGAFLHNWNFSHANDKTISDTYTEDELVRGATWFLQSSRGTKLQVHTGVRDRCMLLISTTSAFRGNNIRSLLLSDLAVRDVPMLDLGLDAKVMVCGYK